MKPRANYVAATSSAYGNSLHKRRTAGMLSAPVRRVLTTLHCVDYAYCKPGGGPNSSPGNFVCPRLPLQVFMITLRRFPFPSQRAQLEIPHLISKRGRSAGLQRPRYRQEESRGWQRSPSALVLTSNCGVEAVRSSRGTLPAATGRCRPTRIWRLKAQCSSGIIMAISHIFVASM